MEKLNRTLLAITIVCVSYLLSAYGDEKTSTPQLKSKKAHYDLGIELIRKGNNTFFINIECFFARAFGYNTDNTFGFFTI